MLILLSRRVFSQLYNSNHLAMQKLWLLCIFRGIRNSSVFNS